MMVLDANLLIYAYDATSPAHKKARRWVEKILSGSDPVGLPWSSIHAFLRIATNTRLFAAPFLMEEAVSIVDQILAARSVRVIEPGERYWSIFRELLNTGQVRGNLVMDAHLAALTMENAGTLYTTDRDFRRFDELRVENPLA